MVRRLERVHYLCTRGTDETPVRTTEAHLAAIDIYARPTLESVLRNTNQSFNRSCLLAGGVSIHRARN
jgi:hypothetical protein